MTTTQETCNVKDPFLCGQPAMYLVKYGDPNLTDAVRCERHAKKSQRSVSRQLGITVELVRL